MYGLLFLVTMTIGIWLTKDLGPTAKLFSIQVPVALAICPLTSLSWYMAFWLLSAKFPMLADYHKFLDNDRQQFQKILFISFWPTWSLAMGFSQYHDQPYPFSEAARKIFVSFGSIIGLMPMPVAFVITMLSM